MSSPHEGQAAPGSSDRLARGRPLRVGIVGCGAVAERYHAPALEQAAALGAVEVGQLMDPNPARTAALRTRFPGASQATSLDAMAGIDLAIVASPVRYHAEQVLALLGRGIHVLCEKPLARTSAEAAGMIAAAEDSGRVLAVGLYKRFFPAVEWVGDLIRTGALGRPLRFHLDEGGRFGWPAVTATNFDRTTAGGGVTMDMGVHMFDIASHWFGAPQSFGYADDAYGGVETNAFGTLRYADGFEGSFRLSWDVPLSGTYAVDFERGWVRWATNTAHAVGFGFDGMRFASEARLALGRKDLPRGLGPDGPRYLAAFTAQLLDVVEAIRDNRPPRVDGPAAAANIGLIERMYAGREVILPPHFTPAERARALELARGGTP